MDDLTAALNQRIAQALRQQPDSYYQRQQELANQPAFNPNTYSYSPPQQAQQQTFYSPAYYQMNPHIPVPVDYPYVVPTR